MYTYKAKVMYVSDGDTIDVIVDLGFSVILGREDNRKTWIRLRVAKINAYETALRGETTPEQKVLGLQAKELAKEKMLGKWVTIRTYPDPKGSFGRWLADVAFEDGGDMIDWGEFLLSEGLAVPYEG